MNIMQKNKQKQKHIFIKVMWEFFLHTIVVFVVLILIYAGLN